MSKWKDREVGALWLKSAADKDYWTGNLNLSDGRSKRIVVFPNKDKDPNSKQPDFRIYLDEQ